MSRTHLLSVTALFLTAAVGRAELHVSEASVKLGQVRRGAPLSHRFSIFNRGRTPLTITDVKAGCGCVTPNLDKRTYQPGEQGALLLEVNTLAQPAGSNTWRMRLCYEQDGQAREGELELSAEVVAEIKVEPVRLILHTRGSIRHPVTMTDLRPEKKLRVIRTHTSSPHLGATIAAAEGDVQRIEVEVRDTLPDGTHEMILAIATDDPDYRELRVPVTVVQRKQGVTASPSIVTLKGTREHPPSQIVLLRGIGGEPVEVEKVEASDPRLVCTWANGPGNMVTLKVKADPNKPVITGNGRSILQVHVRKPVPTTVTIPVSLLLN